MSCSFADIRGGKLFHAVRNNDLPKVQEILVTGVIDAEKEFALVEASEKGFIEIVRLLISSGVNLDRERVLARGNALRQAAWEGHDEIVRLLLKAGANVRLEPDNYRDETALILAVQEGHFNVIKTLVEAGANVNEIRIGKYALLSAALEGYEEIFNYLLPLTNVELIQEAYNELDKGIRRRWREENADELVNDLTNAIYNQDINLVKQILNDRDRFNVSDFDEYGCTPLWWAVCRDSIELIQLMLEAGANPDRGCEEDGRTPLMRLPNLRWNQKSLEIMSLLLDAGANVNAKDFENGRSVLMNLIDFPVFSEDSIFSKDPYPGEQQREVKYKAIQTLLKHGADINAVDHLGKSVLDFAKDTKDVELIELIENSRNE
jgi:uncharacterized protein